MTSVKLSREWVGREVCIFPTPRDLILMGIGIKVRTHYPLGNRIIPNLATVGALGTTWPAALKFLDSNRCLIGNYVISQGYGFLVYNMMTMTTIPYITDLYRYSSVAIHIKHVFKLGIFWCYHEILYQGKLRSLRMILSPLRVKYASKCAHAVWFSWTF